MSSLPTPAVLAASIVTSTREYVADSGNRTSYDVTLRHQGAYHGSSVTVANKVTRCGGDEPVRSFDVDLFVDKSADAVRASGIGDDSLYFHFCSSTLVDGDVGRVDDTTVFVTTAQARALRDALDAALRAVDFPLDGGLDSVREVSMA